MEDNTKIDLIRRTGGSGPGSCVLQRYLLALRRENGEEFLGSIKYEEFLDS